MLSLKVPKTSTFTFFRALIVRSQWFIMYSLALCAPFALTVHKALTCAHFAFTKCLQNIHGSFNVHLSFTRFSFIFIPSPK